MIYEKWQTKCKLMYSIDEFFFVLYMLSSVKNRLKILKFNLWNQIDISIMKELDE